MLKAGMYVRCPADPESARDPRVFLCGQVVEVNEFQRSVTVEVHDPFDYDRLFAYEQKGLRTLPKGQAKRCRLFVGSEVETCGALCTILSAERDEDGFYLYDVQLRATKDVRRVSERDITAPFTNGDVDPTVQLCSYEFQNPCWFMGRAVVSRSMNLLENAIYGFKELAGCKIYLLPHQVNTIMRCLQERPCRFMLADEVGMGKTIEALSVLTIYMAHAAHKNILILVPDTLKEQWKGEMLLKFNLSTGQVKDGHFVQVKTIAELDDDDKERAWDFVIVDEIHRHLGDRDAYALLHRLSAAAENVLLLSATPVQQRKEEYLELLRLLQPSKYDAYNVEHFSALIDKQGRIIQKTVTIMNDLADYEELLDDQWKDGADPHDDEECAEVFADICENLKALCDTLADEKLSALLDAVDFKSSDFGVYAVKVVISYLCGNYQIENKIIRNRRHLLTQSEDGTRLLPTRARQEITYALDKDRNAYEARAYELLTERIAADAAHLDVVRVVRPLLESFFSSPWAFRAQLNTMEDVDEHLRSCAEQWCRAEDDAIPHLPDILDDPDAHEDACCSRLVSVINLLCEELYDQKVVLFTNHAETFEAYCRALAHVFPAEEISFFGTGMSAEEIELNSYRFQNDAVCRVMLCDVTGGEGRNFQCADVLVHLDLPWDANQIEQRIGRLDRLERDPERSKVTSVVVHTEDSFEAALFRFWDEGLKIFTQSLSGMEIIMKDINEDLIDAVQRDFQYGLHERIPRMIALADTMRDAVRKEQHFDASALLLRPLYGKLRRLIDYYAENENELFASTMSNWASLAGFRGHRDAAGTITYTAESFSPKSAENSRLIPPQWNAYLASEQNRFISRVQEEYNERRAIRSQRQSIRGTFQRKQAIENDYLHFFAPGDEVFDCIVNNALRSCKGRAAAFAVQSALEWKGLIFTCAPKLSERELRAQGLSVHALGAYRSYLLSEQVVIPVSIENPDDLTDDAVVREYMRIIRAGFRRNRDVHLGKRGRQARYLRDVIGDMPNIDWFRSAYPTEEWRALVKEARKEALERAAEQYRRRSDYRGAREEMERMLSAREAGSAFYGGADEGITELRRVHNVLLAAMRKLSVTLEAAAFVWMVKSDEGVGDECGT